MSLLGRPEAVASAVTLVVLNSAQLEGRSTSSHVFTTAGGTLGSGVNDDWLLQDYTGRIRPAHAEIRLFDGQFCLIDRSGHTFINQATLPLGRDRRVALRDSDELFLGEYRVRVYLGDRQAGLPGSQPLAALIDMDAERETLAEQGEMENQTTRLTPSVAPRRDDPLAALQAVTPGAGRHDPLMALAHGSEKNTTDESLSSALEEPLQAEVMAHDRQVRCTSTPQNERDEDDMTMSRDRDAELLDDLERSVGEQLEERWQESLPASTGVAGSDPLLRALGAELHFADSEEQLHFISEAGQTLRAAIEGLQALHRAQDDSRYPLRDRRLQPIEDNPLRLGQPYRDTVETLFSARRSPVHLSAPAAVSECLTHQGQHQAAVEEAIGEALQAILDAFAPDALLKRFHAYRGTSGRLTDEGGWAWEMYHHYYQELNSNRQQGFAKLFWEVFEQAYDQSVRHQQRASK